MNNNTIKEWCLVDQMLELVTSQKLTYEQKLISLAHAAEDTLNVINIPSKTKDYFEKGILCSLYEGNAPYRPRYVMPDYERYVKNGSRFLEVDPPKDLDELLNALMIIYHHVPSITSFPVYLGNLDKLMDPFLDGLSDEEIKKKLRLFLNFLDRTITDSFCHANIGPEYTRAGRLLLEVEKDLNNAVPNFTIKYDSDITPDEFGELSIYTSLFCANPAICNHKLNKQAYDCDYGISSCYNILPVGGGAYTLSRLLLPNLAKISGSIDEFLQELLPDALESLANYLNERIRFLVEESGFFQSSFLLQEGLIHKDKFVGMFGITGLAESANILMAETGKRYGHDIEADDLADRIMNIIAEFIEQFPARHSKISNNRFMLHAQVGIERDEGITSGVRIPVGDEPDSMFDHLRHSGRFHKLITSGCGDIFPIETTARSNPAAVLDIVKGAFKEGVKYISFYEENSDLVRITGYLVKRSEMEKYKNEEVVLQNTTQLGAPSYEVNRLADRKVR